MSEANTIIRLERSIKKIGGFLAESAGSTWYLPREIDNEQIVQRYLIWPTWQRVISFPT